MKLIKFTPQKNTAQAMVEFAIVLPLLLLLLYGLLEVGRLLFIYSTTVTASRQAVRYGATTGGGTGGVARFQDCIGIRQAANRVDFLNAFDHTSNDVQIFWDTGPGTTQTPICAPGTPSQSWTPAPGNNTRLVVRVEGAFNPIVRLVPLPQRDIETTSMRTILMSVPIAVSGSGADTTNLELTLAPHRNPPDGPHSDVGETVVATATVTNTTGSTVPTGTVDFIVRDSLGTEVARCDDVGLNSSGIATCNITFNKEDAFNVHAEYTPTSTSLFAPSSDDEQQKVGKASTTTQIISDYPDTSQPGQVVIIRVRVTSSFGSIPTGPIVVTTAEGTCTINLTTIDAGVGGCSVTYNNVGTTNITAAYGGDSRHKDSTSPAEPHTVATTAPTHAPTAIPPTSAPPTTGPTAPPTPVTNCNTIKDTINATSSPIKWSTNTMYLNIPNTNGYPVTAGNIYVAWNYDKGHIGSNSNLKLLNVKIDSTIIWESTTGIHQPNYTITSFSNPAVFPANHTAKLTFTFDQSYNRQSGEQIQVQFSTPGCEPYPVLVPVGSSTPVPPTSTASTLKLQYRAADTDAGNNWVRPHFNIFNLSTSAVPLSELKIRYWYTREGSASQVFTCDYAAIIGGCSNLSGAFTALVPSRTGANFYLEISFAAAAGSIPAGSQTGEIQAGFHNSDWSNYTETGDYSFDPTKVSFADWTRVTLYRNGVLVWGTEP